MHPLEREILALCQENGLFRPGEHLVVGVSGGPDSMALLHLLARLAQQLTITMVVAHADHGLRPEASADEEQLVRKEAARLGLTCVVDHLAVKERARGQGQSLEEAARDLRYAFFATVAASHDAHKIAVAHTADDQAEEVLLRLLRGSGKKGLSGMSLLRQGSVVRPLLTTTKARLLAYLRERSIPFALDQSNSDRRYLRNRVRLDLLPYLAQFNPNIKQTLRQTATILRDEEEVLAAQAESEYRQLVSEGREVTGPTVSVARVQFNGRPLAIRRRLAEQMLIHLGSKPGFRQIEGLIALAHGSAVGELHLRHGLRASAAQDLLRLWYPQGKKAHRHHTRATPHPFQLQLPQPGRYPLPDSNREILVELVSAALPLDEMNRAGADLLDADLAPFPLLIRSRLPGDRFRPLNSKGKKTVSDFLTDLKMPPGQRDTLPLLLRGDEIIALLGVRIAHHYRVTASSTSILKVTIRPA